MNEVPVSAAVAPAPQRVRLRGIGEAMVRAVGPDDFALEQAFISGLDTATLRQRTLGGAGTPSRAQILQLLDYRTGPSMALGLIVAPGTPDEALAAVARYAPADIDGADRRTPPTAEFAIVVADRFHGRGLGTELLRRLHRVASQAGYRRMIGDTMSDNVAMIRLATHLGYQVSPHPQDGTLRRLTRRLRRSGAAGASAERIGVERRVASEPPAG